MAAEADLTAAELEALDPHPNVHALFSYYNQLYFDDCLGACSVEWSTKRMTLCAGMCHFQRGGGCRIKLSEPLLKYRPVRDLKETLLHEMIHAELFLNDVRDDGDHGPKFRARMEAINTATFPDMQRPPGGYNITVFHTMHDEVNLYRTHVWCCNRCGNTVKRAMNRPPQEADCRAYSKAAAAAAAAAGAPGAYCADPRCWYHSHVRECGGRYDKVQEPEKPQQATAVAGKQANSGSSNKRLRQPTVAGAKPIEAFFKPRSEQPQQQQAQGQAGSPESLPQQEPQQWQQQPSQTSLQQQQQQHQQQQDGDYWLRLGKCRLLGGGQGHARPAGASGAEQDGQPVHSQPHAAQQQQQQQQKLQHNDEQHHKQQQVQPSQVDGDIVELLSSDDEEGEAATAGGNGTDQQVACALSCPVCCLEWLPGEVSLDELNRHVNGCLARL